MVMEMVIAHSASSILSRALQDISHLISPGRPNVTVALVGSPGPGKTARPAPLPPLGSKKAE
jgi:hypothetical protein